MTDSKETKQSKKRTNPTDVDPNQPPQKQRKLEPTASDTEQKQTSDNVECSSLRKKVSLILQTKLGESSASFKVEDLQQIEYFKSQLSDRWNHSNDDVITITNDELVFGVEEINALIHYKKHRHIDPFQAGDRLVYFCNALDYFAERISNDAFLQYIQNHVPLFSPSSLMEIKSACREQPQQHDVIKTLISVIEKQELCDRKMQRKMYDKFVKQWRQHNKQMLTCNACVAASIFKQQFKAFRKESTDGEIADVAVKLLTYQRTENIAHLWQYIVNERLYVKYPCLLDSITDVVRKLREFAELGLYIEESTPPERVKIFIRIVADAVSWISKGEVETDCKASALISGACRSVWSAGFCRDLITMIQQHMLELESLNMDKYASLIACAAAESSADWLSDCVQSHETWIIDELPKKLSKAAIEPLVDSICDHFKTEKSVKSSYSAFLSNYAGLNLKTEI